MLRLASLVLFSFLCLSPLSAGPALAQSDVLPGIDADGSTLPLTVDQLDPNERAIYATLSADDARRFLYVRGYLRYARLVVSRQMPPIELPALPARANWGRHLLTEEEARDVLDVALGMNMLAMMNQMSPPN